MAWKPTDISGCVLWLDAKAIAGLADGDKIASWVDRAASIAFTQSTDANRPTYKLASLNGKPSVRFSGSANTWLENSSWSGVSGVSGYTVFFIMACNIFTNNRLIFYTSGDWDLGQVYSNYLYFDTAYSTQSRAPFSTNQNVITAIFDGGLAEGERQKIYYNGTPQSTSVSSGNPGTSTGTHTGCGIGGRVNHAAVNAFDGDIAEMLVYNTALSNTDRDKVEKYLAWLYFSGADTGGFSDSIPTPIYMGGM